jgi:probable HAF family extracellular repeat protein
VSAGSIGAAAHAAAHDSAAAIFPVGTPGSATYGAAINQRGQVAGTDYFGNNAPLWTAFEYAGLSSGSSLISDLETLGGVDSLAYAINESGQIVGASEIRPGDRYTIHAFLYTGTPGNGGTMADLGTLGGSSSRGLGVNNLARIVGESQTTTGLSHAFLYSGIPGNGGSMADLGTLGGAESEASAINDAGQITGDSGTAVVPHHAFLYQGVPGSGGTMTDIGSLIGPEGSSHGQAINALGQIVGGSSSAEGWQHAFFYGGSLEHGGTLADLGTLGGHESIATGINTKGQIVGFSDTGVAEHPDVRHAFIYSGTPGGGGQMIDLNTWLAAHNPAEAAKWTLYGANGISDNGLITGSGLYDDGPGGLSDGYCAFVLDAHTLVPEPSSFMLIAFGLIIVVCKITVIQCPGFAGRGAKSAKLPPCSGVFSTSRPSSASSCAWC